MAQLLRLRHFFIVKLFAFLPAPALRIKLENKFPGCPGLVTSKKYPRHCIAGAGDA
jgi:hypothetical protein